MGVLTLEGRVEGGRIRLLDDAKLPENTRVYVVVPRSAREMSRVWSPRLLDQGEAEQFVMQVDEAPEDRLDAEV